MNDSALPPSFAARIADYERRLANVERSPRLTNASISGFLKLKNEGVETFFVGTDTDGKQALRIQNGPTEPAVWWDEDYGLLYPYSQSGWMDNSVTKAVTSATHLDWYVSRVGCIQSSFIEAAIQITAPVGTSYEVQLRHLYSGGPASVTSPTVAGTGVAQNCTVKWRHNIPHARGPIMWTWSVRRVSGAGTISMYEPYDIVQGSFEVVSSAWTVI